MKTFNKKPTKYKICSKCGDHGERCDCEKTKRYFLISETLMLTLNQIAHPTEFYIGIHRNKNGTWLPINRIEADRALLCYDYITRGKFDMYSKSHDTLYLDFDIPEATEESKLFVNRRVGQEFVTVATFTGNVVCQLYTRFTYVD